MSMQNRKVPGRTPSLLLHLLLYVRVQIHQQLEQDTFANIRRVKLLSKIPQLSLWKLNVLSYCSCLACTVEQDLPKAMEKFFRRNTALAVQIWESPLCKARESFSSLLRKMPKSTSWFFCSKWCSGTTVKPQVLWNPTTFQHQALCLHCASSHINRLFHIKLMQIHQMQAWNSYRKPWRWYKLISSPLLPGLSLLTSFQESN